MTYDPFTAEIAPLEPLDNEQAVISHLQRSMMWDIVGPAGIRKNPERFGQNPASQDVMDKEFEEMVLRKNALSSFGFRLPLLTHIAVESASQALLATDPRYSIYTDAEKLQFRMDNARLTTVVTETVISHLLQGGLIHFGGHQ